MSADSNENSIVRRYSQLARAALDGQAIRDSEPDASQDGCFGSAAYGDESGAPQSAFQASLGCGNPLAVCDLKPGETVLDLGSGGGLDVLLSARRVAPDGVVYGLDASTDMLALARANAEKAQVTNARFLRGQIEDIPLPDEHVDVIISNCVINLSGNKARVIDEAYRVLKAGGRLGVSDITVDEGADPQQIASAEQQVGCTAGALTGREYEQLLVSAGFTGVTITSTRQPAPGLNTAIVRAAKPAAVVPPQGRDSAAT
jgi:arsenite methyltransferase